MKISINPPPTDKSCECCGKNVKDLKPFGKAGDPLVGDFNGALLIKTYRTMAPHLDEVELERKFDGHCTEDKEFYEQAMDTVGASWECRSCIVLGDDYFKVKRNRK